MPRRRGVKRDRASSGTFTPGQTKRIGGFCIVMPDGTRCFCIRGDIHVDLVPAPTHLCEWRYGTAHNAAPSARA